MDWRSIMDCADIVLTDGRVGAECDFDCWACETAEKLGCCPVQIDEIEMELNANEQKE